MKYVWEEEDIEGGAFVFDSSGSPLLITYSNIDRPHNKDAPDAMWGFACINDGQADNRGLTKAGVADQLTKIGATPKDKDALKPYRGWRFIKAALENLESVS